MGVYDAMRASNRVVNYINSQQDKIDIDEPKTKSRRQQYIHLNKLLLKFGKEKGIELLKSNSPKYKGSFSPFMANCESIQEHFADFKLWLIENYKK